jgi:16S rRNA (guanine527-N7)-methyltransferase
VRVAKTAENAADLAADRAEAVAQADVSRETWARIDRFVALLLHWQRTTNLIAASNIPRLYTRHVADSLQLATAIPRAIHYMDLGSGGGFPGLVLACALADTPGAAVHLVESNGKKAAFLREAARAAGVPAVVHAGRIEEVVPAFPGPIDVVTARALAPLADLLGLAYPLLHKGAVGLFPKGQDVEAELTEASKSWNMTADLLPSRTDPKGRIVVVRALAPKGDRR